MKIAVLFGGISTERNVSIAGGKAVIAALESLGHKVIPIDPAFGKDALEKSKELLTDLSAFPDMDDLRQYHTRNYIDCINSDFFDDIDVAFLVLHGMNGEDGFIQSLLHLRKVPFTGSNTRASAAAMDKNFSKLIFAGAGVNTPLWTAIQRHEIDDDSLRKEIRGYLGKELVVKPNDQGSTIGITIIRDGNLEDLDSAIRLAAKYSETIIIERFISGREITVGIVGGEPLPIIEIIPDEGFYDYKAKYTKGHTEYVCPAEISPDIADFVTNMALTANAALGCTGFSRADFRLSEDGEAYCLELNTIPGFTETSLVPMAAREIGIDFPQLCEKIINLALEEYKRINND